MKNFQYLKLSHFTIFDIGRWDIIFEKQKIIKLPVRKFFKKFKKLLKIE